MNETTESMDRFRDYFQLATGVQPYPYQERLALAPAGEFPEVLNAFPDAEILDDKHRRR